MLLSVCIITKNEASNIRSCLDSVQKIADEILLLDAFSTDATVSIAQQYTPHIYQKEWTGDFSQARNFIISKATCEWILIIDADETFVFLPDFISHLRQTNEKTFSIIRKEMYTQTNSYKKVCFPVNIIRLFRRTTNAQFHYPIHERLDDFFMKESIKVSINQHCHLKHHISTKTAFVDSKQEKYLQQINTFLTTNPTDEWLMYQKIKTLKYFQRTQEILQLVKQFSPHDTKIRVATKVIVSQIYMENNKFDEAIVLLKSINPQETYPIVCMLLGDIYFKQKKLTKALHQYRKLQTSTKFMHFSQAMYIVTYCEKADKIYKIASVLYTKKLYLICLLYLGLHKKHLQADSLLLYALLFLKKNNQQQALYYIQKAREKDPTWQKLIDLERELSK